MRGPVLPEVGETFPNHLSEKTEAREKQKLLTKPLGNGGGEGGSSFSHAPAQNIMHHKKVAITIHSWAPAPPDRPVSLIHSHGVCTHR